MDETFKPISYKGNHKKSGFVMPRPVCKGRIEHAYLKDALKGNHNLYG
ncbi:hypothetical protein JOC62_000130 [Clostridium sardiniense]|nr:hypothetical protein [Clostridium sardiniense]